MVVWKSWSCCSCPSFLPTSHTRDRARANLLIGNPLLLGTFNTESWANWRTRDGLGNAVNLVLAWQGISRSVGFHSMQWDELTVALECTVRVSLGNLRNFLPQVSSAGILCILLQAYAALGDGFSVEDLKDTISALVQLAIQHDGNLPSSLPVRTKAEDLVQICHGSVSLCCFSRTSSPCGSPALSCSPTTSESQI
jgi:hypothetical protein